jgi:hypothetical protein
MWIDTPAQCVPCSGRQRDEDEEMQPNQAKLDDLARDASSRGRGRLLIDLTRLVLSDRAMEGRELEMFFDIVRSILPESAVVYRRRFSETAADHQAVPIDVLMTLAGDEIAVAAPVLVRSRGLTDPHLVDIARGESDDHRLAIAARTSVSGEVTEVLVRLGSRAVLHRLGGNVGALFNNAAIEEIGRRAEGDDALVRLLGSRRDLGAYFDGDVHIAPPPRTASGKGGSVPGHVSRSENVGVSRLLADMREGKRKPDDIVVELANADRHADLARFLGEIAEIDESQILRVLVRADANGIATVMRGLDFSPETYVRVVELRRRKLRFSAAQARWENEHFVRLDVVEARVTLSAFTDRRKQA